MPELKKKVLEILEVVKLCPENLQSMCFELLLKDYLTGGKHKDLPPLGAKEEGVGEQKTKGDDKLQTEQEQMNQEDIAAKDIHLKARKFLEKYKLSIDEINRLFYKEGGAILPLFDDLRTTRTSEAQVRIALIQCLLSALGSGEFQTEVENIRSECQERKCYDKNNFGANFNNNIGLFDVEKYGRDVNTLRLSEAGKEELSKLISELE
jgi:hypothetical protein